MKYEFGMFVFHENEALTKEIVGKWERKWTQNKREHEGREQLREWLMILIDAAAAPEWKCQTYIYLYMYQCMYVQ